jgi:DNA-binding response OmpR family regulator
MTAATRRRVLVVEDDDGARGALFRLNGFDPVGTSSVAEGLGAMAEVPDVAVVDLMLPDGGGEAVVRALRGAPGRVCVVVCTGVADPVRMEAVRSLGPDAVLLKPISVSEVLSICDGSRPGGPTTPSN